MIFFSRDRGLGGLRGKSPFFSENALFLGPEFSQGSCSLVPASSPWAYACLWRTFLAERASLWVELPWDRGFWPPTEGPPLTHPGHLGQCYSQVVSLARHFWVWSLFYWRQDIQLRPACAPQWSPSIIRACVGGRAALQSLRTVPSLNPPGLAEPNSALAVSSCRNSLSPPLSCEQEIVISGPGRPADSLSARHFLSWTPCNLLSVELAKRHAASICGFLFEEAER